MPQRGYLSLMRRLFAWLFWAGWLAVALSAPAATGRVFKVLPQFLDHKDRNSTSPSLYDRDAYQAYLRQHTNEISRMRFNVQWRTAGKPAGPVKLRVEMHGIVRGGSAEELVLEKPVEPSGWFGCWTAMTLTREDFRRLGEVTAWRVTLWDNGQLLGEQRSFLW